MTQTPNTDSKGANKNKINEKKNLIDAQDLIMRVLIHWRLQSM